MAVLGVNGIVRLRREAPDPLVLPQVAMRPDIDVFLVRNQDYWNGDEVRLFSPDGLPLSTDALPNGVGCYFGSVWELGSNRNHVSSESDNYYQSDSAYFYNRGAPINSATYYIYRDQLDRISFYTTRAAALAGSTANRIDLRSLAFDFLVVSAAGTEEYDNAIAECVAAAGDYRFSDFRDEVTLASICDYAPLYEQPVAGTTEYDNADLQPRRWINGFPWLIQGQLQQWSIELNAENIDTTAVGQTFGDNIKSIVSGGGSFDFIVERTTNEGSYDSTALMQLLLLTEKGSKAEAEFYMINARPESCGQLAPGDLYYKCDILITNSAVNTRADEIIVGTAKFVTTGSIELKMGT